MTTDAIRKLLGFDEIDELRKKMLRTFDPFQTLGIEHYELRHTTTLAWLLNPEGSHKLGDKFLRLFVSGLGQEGLSLPASQDVMVLTEVGLRKVKGSAQWVFGAAAGPSQDADGATPGTAGPEDSGPTSDPGAPGTPSSKKKREKGRLDLLLECCDWAIAIEAKIWATEGEDQLDSYRSAMANQYRSRPFKCFFLTVDGSDASRPDQWTAISWMKNVHEPLSRLVPDLPRDTQEDEEAFNFIGHYLRLIERVCDPSKSAFAKELKGIAKAKHIAEILPEAERELAAFRKAKAFDAVIAHDGWFLDELFRHVQSWRGAMVEAMMGTLQPPGATPFWTDRTPSKRGTIQFLPAGWSPEQVMRHGRQALLYKIEVKDAEGNRKRRSAEAFQAAPPAERMVEVKLWMPDDGPQDPNHDLKSSIWELAKDSPCNLIKARPKQKGARFVDSGKLFTASFAYDDDYRLDPSWFAFVEKFRDITDAQKKLLWLDGRLLGEDGRTRLECACGGKHGLCQSIPSFKKPRAKRRASKSAAVTVLAP